MNINSNQIKEIFTKEEYLIKLKDVERSLVIYKDDDFIVKELSLRKKELEIILDYLDRKEGSYKCKFCKEPFELKKDNLYLAEYTVPFSNYKSTAEAFDCPHCGCQNIINPSHKKRVSI